MTNSAIIGVVAYQTFHKSLIKNCPSGGAVAQ